MIAAIIGVTAAFIIGALDCRRFASHFKETHACGYPPFRANAGSSATSHSTASKLRNVLLPTKDFTTTFYST